MWGVGRGCHADGFTGAREWRNAAARIGRRIRQRERLLLIAIARLTVHVSRVVHRRHVLGSQRRYSNVRRQPGPLTAALPHTAPKATDMVWN